MYFYNPHSLWKNGEIQISRKEQRSSFISHNKKYIDTKHDHSYLCRSSHSDEGRIAFRLQLRKIWNRHILLISILQISEHVKGSIYCTNVPSNNNNTYSTSSSQKCICFIDKQQQPIVPKEKIFFVFKAHNKKGTTSPYFLRNKLQLRGRQS